MKSYVILIIAAVVLTLSCSEGVTESRERIIRAPQDMIWTADTIKGIGTATQLIPGNLLVFAPNDAWLVCWSDIARGLIWHFDGKTWTESNIAKDVGGMRVNDIAGYSSNDLWTCGYTGDEIFLAHYNGRNWEKYNTTGIKGELLDMCKDADGNLWACGRNGLIMKYDKTKWTRETFYIPLPPNSADFFFKSITVFNYDAHLLLTSIRTNPWLEKYYHVIGQMGHWVITDSIVIDSPGANIKWGYRGLFSENTLWSYGIYGVWKYDLNKWEHKFLIDNAINSIYGFGNDYLLAVGDSKTALFNNGSSWQNFSSVLKVTNPYFVFRNVWTSGYETFITGDNNDGKVIVWRGK